MTNPKKLSLVARSPFEVSVVAFCAAGLSNAEIAANFTDISESEVESTLNSLDQRAAKDYRNP